MRLNSIKLSGFKSFAEPTHFLLPGQLVGVVGPNGCGKSNIMDAVRWVLGESRASELRGESMQDVIFNGTNTRKPASRASVELVFDNTDQRAGGQWGQFAEIAVKRVLTRDGTSSYYINNQPVRRRDVQDVFLGTGLGPRAYAIIGQGTISRIIESKPEELRLFLEEAAGVSKYKERRRETANRLSDTRENLVRVEDILRELNAHLGKLEQQAQVALRYNALQDEVNLKQQQLWFLKRAESQASQSKIKIEIDQAVNQLESRMADLRAKQAELEGVRQAHYAAGDQVNQAQAKLYEANAQVGRLEAEIRFVVEGRMRVEQRLAQLQVQSAQWIQRQQEGAAETENLAVQLEQAQEQTAAFEDQLQELAAQWPALEESLQAAQRQADAQRTDAAQVQQQLQVLAAEQRSVQEQMRALQARHEKLASDQNGLATPDAAELAQLGKQFHAAQENLEVLQARWQELNEQAPQLDEARRSCQQSLSHELAKQADVSARLQALETLQEKVKTDGKLKPWLAKHGLEHLQALWSRLHIERGWENALEAALRERLAALEVSQLEMVKGFSGAQGRDAPPAKLAFYALPGVAAHPVSHAVHGLKPLADLLRGGDVAQTALLQGWLQDCYVADDLDAALAVREKLQWGQVVYVPSGHAVTSCSVSFYAQDSEQAGLLARAQEIENLDKQRKAQTLICDEARTSLARAEAVYAEVTQSLQTAGRERAEMQTRTHALQVELLRQSQLAEQTRVRVEQIQADLLDVTNQTEALQERLTVAQARFEELDLQLADSQQLQAQREEQAQACQAQLHAAREQQRAVERRAQEADFLQRGLQARQQELQRSMEVAREQAAEIANEQQQAQEELVRLTDAQAQAGLQTVLNLKMERETDLGTKRQHYDELTAHLKRSDEQRLQFELELEPLRQRISEYQLKEQAARLGFEQYTQLLADVQADLAALESAIERGDVLLAGLQGQIDRAHRDIQALGAVNLAALDELTAVRERKHFLDAQAADLNEAMSTLEEAIKKMDMETRELLGSTFAQVNQHFSVMFPKLFGGGHACLVMTGDEILDAGVQVMAHPPGKKNQTIHLLSGGEKALTAIALVFAIFQLNPAPFCLLDEVDAPLDDANTERYAKLVSSMSQSTQFLFISHNKIAMEMAQQLIGVTMQEQGVSRIVAVDIQAALSMTQTMALAAS